MGTSVNVASNYSQALASHFDNAEIHYNGPCAEILALPDGSEVTLTDLGAMVKIPGAVPNRFIPYGSILDIREHVPEPARAAGPDDGQAHD